VHGAAALALGLSVLAAGCGGLGGSGDEYEATTVTRTTGLKTFPDPGRVDDAAGTYRGVGIGSTADEMKRVFGPIGDPLDRAAQAYPGLECGEQNEGTENRPYPACTGRVAPERYIWFGGDPITAGTRSFILGA
jgi:hypothetical protein